MQPYGILRLGDYYIEFAYTATGGFGALDAILQYFDCTVAL